ncbi:hypothetical protein BJ875DRAFT_372511, partial [Amylocarpus encephaloides]
METISVSFVDLTIISTSEVQLPKTLTSFKRFSDLAIELRLEIWGWTLLPRKVKAMFVKVPSPGFRSTASLPSALKACQESREFALTRYPLCFGSIKYPAIIRFNPDLDILY